MMRTYIIENGEPVETQRGDQATHVLVPLPLAHDVCRSHGVDRQRLEAALKANDNWGKMVHAFEFLTAAGAMLATWPKEGT